MRLNAWSTPHNFCPFYSHFYSSIFKHITKKKTSPGFTLFFGSRKVALPDWILISKMHMIASIYSVI